MKTDRLYSSLVFSLSLHTLLVVVSVLYITYFSTHHKTVVFDVSLVSPSETNGPPAGAHQQSMEAPAPKEEKSVAPAEKPEMVTPKDKMSVNDRIAALEAMRRIEKIAKLRKSVAISASKGTSASKATGSGSGKGGSADYISIVGTRIHQYWAFPETADRDLLAIITIRISMSGSVTIEGFEKKSGNALFDRAALRAINNAMPLPPPPSEMEIGVRFTP